MSCPSLWHKCALAVTALLGVDQAYGNVYTVDRLDDIDTVAATICSTAPNDCSLRGALRLTNSIPGLDTVVLPAGTYNRSPVATSELLIDDTLELRGHGASTTIIDAKENNRVFKVSAPLIASDVWIRGGTTPDIGGGVYVEGDSDAKATFERCIISNNLSHQDGGGVFAYANTTFIDSTIRDNVTGGDGGGIAVGQGVPGAVTITKSTISNNQANDNGGGISNKSAAIIVNSTVAGNVAQTGHGGGIYSENHTTQLVNSTVTNAGAPTATGIYNQNSEIEIMNTIVVGGCVNAGGSYVSHGGNLEAAGATCGFNQASDQVNVAAPGLAPLADNGYLTQTIALNGSSPAVNAGSESGCQATDQRGIPRPQFGRCDIGAFELAETAPAVASATVPALGVAPLIALAALLGIGGLAGIKPER